MIDSLDIRTLSLTLVLFCWLYSVGLFLSSLGLKRPLSSQLWAASIASEGVAFLLLGLRDFIPPFISVVIANLLIAIGMILSQRGIEEFNNQRVIPTWTHFVLLIVLALLFFNYSFIDPDINVRIILISLLLAAQSLLCIWLLKRAQGSALPLSRWMAISVFAAFGGFMLLRSLWTFYETSIPDFMQSGTIHALAFLAFLLLVSGKSFSFVWLHNQEMTESLRLLARTDGLTGILNRRALFEELERELLKSHRHSRPLSMVILDIDHFKSINDRYGHSSGDKALIQLAKILKQELRNIDLFGRFGGEEFVIVLPDTNQQETIEIVERIRFKISAEDISASDGTFSITASFGIATLGEHGNDSDSLTNAADSALYKAKSKGRNCVVLATEANHISSSPVAIS